MRPSRAAIRCFLLAWFCGATIGPLGDHFHVAQGVTEYLTDFGPIWFGNSPLWFVLLVATFMAVLAVAHGWLADRDAPQAPYATALLSPLVVGGLYLLTSFYPWREGGSLELLMLAAAVLMYRTLDRTRAGLYLGLLAAAFATAFEWALVQAGVFRYLPESDELFGVAPWLLPLYFSASASVNAVARRVMRPASRP